MSDPMKFEAVLLVGAGTREFFPLLSKDVPKPLLPVANRPLLSYSLELLEACGLRSVLIAVNGDGLALQVSSWIAETYGDRIKAEVAAVAEEAESADALREVVHRLTADDILVLSGDVVGDISLGSLAATHRRHGAAATVLLHPRPAAGPTEGPPKPNRNKGEVADCCAIDASGTTLVAFTSGKQQLHLRRSHLQLGNGHVTVSSSLLPSNIYAFRRRVLEEALHTHPSLSCIKRDLLPLLVRNQGVGPPSTPPSLSASMSHTAVAQSGSRCCVHILPATSYIATVDSLQALVEVNQKVAGEALHLSGHVGSLVSDTSEIGPKSTVGPHCLVGAYTRLGEKCSIKKSTLGPNCRLGGGVKVANSLLMDGVVVGDGCSIHNSVVGGGVQMMDHSSLKDCFVAPGVVVGAGVEYKGEVVARKEKTDR